ncbi:MAG: choice-of-anchor tandem repeat GloVer-containing protein, partial [Terriglobales bacterium]
KTLHSFQDNGDGGQPEGTLVFNTKGDLCGTASSGGPSGEGTLFRLRPQPGGSWRFAALYEFNAPPDAAYPSAKLIFDEAGNAYSTTQEGEAVRHVPITAAAPFSKFSRSWKEEKPNSVARRKQ